MCAGNSPFHHAHWIPPPTLQHLACNLVSNLLLSSPQVKDEGSFQRSLSGGMLTVTALVLMVLLFLGELR